MANSCKLGVKFFTPISAINIRCFFSSFFCLSPLKRMSHPLPFFPSLSTLRESTVCYVHEIPLSGARLQFPRIPLSFCEIVPYISCLLLFSSPWCQFPGGGDPYRPASAAAAAAASPYGPFYGGGPSSRPYESSSYPSSSSATAASPMAPTPVCPPSYYPSHLGNNSREATNIISFLSNNVLYLIQLAIFNLNFI